MTDSFVDLAYRGLSLVKRVKLVQVRPSSGYLEMPAPMPVGTALTISTDDAVTFPAVVTAIHEQVGGASVTPGMEVRPTLDDQPVASWWQARVTLPEAPPPAPRTIVEPAKPEAPPLAPKITAPMAAVNAPTDTIASNASAVAMVAAAPAPADAAPPAPMIEDDHSKRTMVMDAMSAEILAEMSAGDSNPRLIDDGRKTEMMASVDLAALGLDASQSGRMPTITEEGGDDEDNGDKPPERPSQASVKRRKKKR